MEKTRHFFEESIYLVNNHAVACNPMFVDEKLQIYFIEKMEHYLSPICNIIAYDLHDNSFQIIVKLKDRSAFEKHFIQKKKKKKELLISEIPDSTYLFSQAMANLQVSFVKHFNFRTQRSGTLMAGRFNRKLVEDELELRALVEQLNSNVKGHSYAKQWVHRMKISPKKMNSEWLYRGEELVKKSFSRIYRRVDEINLVAVFKNLPPKRLESTKNYFTKKFNLLFGPNSS